MSTSGSYDFTVTRDNLIEDALKHIGVLGEGQSASTNQLTEGSRLLNMMLKLRAAEGMPLWLIKRASILPFTGTSSIASNSHVVSFYDTTTLAADAAASATALTITAAGTIANSDQIGIELDDGSMFWTTVSAGGGTTSLTIASGLTSAAGEGNRVYAYTASADRIQRPVEILEANMLEVTGNHTWSIQLLSRSDYYALGNRASEGVTNGLYYDVGLGTSTADPSSSTNWYGTFYVYPRFANGDYVIEFSYKKPVQDMDSTSQNVEFPQEFYLPLMLELAALHAPKSGLTIEDRRALFAEAKAYREDALATVDETGSFRMMPNGNDHS